ncbi:MAG: protein translocase subunit SecD [bacterium]|nr:protein translocase subunit SecD [candidate division WOR-3 bacterium]
MRQVRIKIVIIIVAVILGLYSLYPTYQLYKQIPAKEEGLKKRLSQALTKDDSLRIGIELAESDHEKVKIHKKALHLGLDLVGGMHLTLEVDKTKLSKEEARDAGDRALEVIRNRIDQFGVFEPIIQKSGQDRVLIQLPGVDRQRAKTLIGQTALLEFRLVQEERQTYDLLKRIDDHYRRVANEDTMLKEQGQFLDYIITVQKIDYGVEETDYPAFQKMLAGADTLVPPDYEFLFGPAESFEGRTVRRLYLVKKEAELTGSSISDANPSPYSGNDPNLASTWIVSLKLARKDAAKFASVTGRNVGKRLAIILDRIVRSAPVVRERIPGGEAMITTGDVNPDKAKDLTILLRSGSLPAPVMVVEERSVGPSLGHDSIRKGVQASILGSVIVFIIMIMVYSLSGIVADIGLFFNIFFLVAVLAGIRATLTLGGLAGIALTIGMSVDANVLIFERIREELRWNKTIRAAIENGYKRAFVTIMDSNITTIVAVIPLYIWGSGSIKGFATTLIIGLIINIFTAVYLTRAVYDFALAQFDIKKLRIG